MSKAEQLITRAFDENNEWLSVVPDDYRRFSSVPVHPARADVNISNIIIIGFS